MKTVRFAEVVKRSGRPHVHALWVRPEQDRELKRALQSRRVMTIESGNGKADIGEVGMPTGHAPGMQLLVFPKSLERFAGKRIVGIKFDLVAQPTVVAAKVRDTLTGQRWDHRHRRKDTAAIHRRFAASSHRASGQRAEAEIRPQPDEPPKATVGREGPPRSKRVRPPKGATSRSGAAKSSFSKDDALREAVIAALSDLRDGKTVAAYQRLENALARG